MKSLGFTGKGEAEFYDLQRTAIFLQRFSEMKKKPSSKGTI